MTETELRPRFYEGQYLGATDLTAAVDYSRSQLSRVLLGAHRWGIALGLDLVEVAGPNGATDVFVEPGYAWDGFGRPILVSQPTKLAAAQFAAFDAGFVSGGTPPPPVVVQVWLAYDETMTQGPQPGFETCDATQAYARVLESFRIDVGPKATLSSRRDPVEIAGRSVDAAQALVTFDASAPQLDDADVPQQVLPADVTQQWLVPLGVVAWQPGDPGSFTPRDAAALQRSARSRQYCGAVAGSIEANGGHVTVHDRAAAYSTDVTDELLWVEGSVRSDGDVHLYGSALGFVATHAETPVKPFQLRRADDAGAGTVTLRMVIGDQNAGANRLAVGPQTAPGSYTDQLVVTDDGRVGVGTSDPHAPLHLPADGVQFGTSATPTDDFYVQANTDGGPHGLRTYNGDARAGGTHVATLTADGRLGIGTTAPSAPAHVVPPTGIRQGSLYLGGDGRWSSLSFNAHHRADNSGWEWDDTSKPIVTLEMDASDGTPRFEVFASPPGNNQTWLSRLRVFGHSGDVVLGANGGGLGVGVLTPAAAVDVNGDVQATGALRTGGLPAVAADQSLRMVAGVVDSAGGVRSGTGFSISSNGTGRWKITFGTPFVGTPTLVAGRVYGDPAIDAGSSVDAGQTAVVDQVTASGAIVATADSAGTLAAGAFTFIAIGGR